MVEGGESEKKKYFCLHCGHVFDSDRDAPKCPNCGRRKVIPLETLGESLKKHKDKLKELGVLPEPDPEPQKPVVEVQGHNKGCCGVEITILIKPACGR
ncbi:hypothetical protein TEU_07540 [Thermococcus eurythermalis]|uniref:Rubredoxin-like domain-containing protein n=2 Tax=Thermococcus eurythermalis TaxID=1505907 RepID=A0A097QUP4_9EURY|nr:hypothetical protein TEU_07540 [Thermococcus eurythermalis]